MKCLYHVCALLPICEGWGVIPQPRAVRDPRSTLITCVEQQDAVADAVAAKDEEIRKLRHELQALSEERAKGDMMQPYGIWLSSRVKNATGDVSIPFDSWLSDEMAKLQQTYPRRPRRDKRRRELARKSGTRSHIDRIAQNAVYNAVKAESMLIDAELARSALEEQKALAIVEEQKAESDFGIDAIIDLVTTRSAREEERAETALAEQKKDLRTLLNEQGPKLFDLFREWDSDGDGGVDKYEFRKAVTALGYTPPKSQIDALFDSMDVDGSGVIEYDELKNALSDKSEFGIEAVIAHAKSVTKPKPHMRLFGRLPQGFDPVPVEALIAKRARARLRMHYSEADRLQRRIERLGVKLDDRRRTWSVIKGWKKMQEELELEEEQSRRLKQQQEQQQQQQQQQHADAEPLHVYSLLLDDQGA